MSLKQFFRHYWPEPKRRREEKSLQGWMDYLEGGTRDLSTDLTQGEVLFLLPYSHEKFITLPYLATALARHFQCGIAYLDHQETSSAAQNPWRTLAASFRARCTLDHDRMQIGSESIWEKAGRIHRGLTCKEDLLRLEINGIVAGDLIHDEYLRMQLRAEVDWKDPALHSSLFFALWIHEHLERYLNTRQVKALALCGNAYTRSLLPARMAATYGIPSFYLHETLLLSRMDHRDERGDRILTGRGPYFHFKRDFSKLAPAEQASARLWAKKRIMTHLAGTRSLVSPDRLSSFLPRGGNRLLRPGPRPKILVMLNDFCDSVHSFRDLLFPDYVEWADFLFSQARESSWEWYAKPHPNTREKGKTELNNATVRELSRRHPHVHFLDGSDSNQQLVEEGIRTVFTAHGTAGYEFAYLGLPVVNAGDNRQINYSFNFNPGSREELAGFVRNAGTLSLPISKDEVEEFVYMNHCHHQKVPVAFWEQHSGLYEALENLKHEVAGVLYYEKILNYLRNHPDCALEGLVLQQVQYWMKYSNQ